MTALPRIRLRSALTLAAAVALLLIHAQIASADASALRILMVIDTDAGKRGGSDDFHRAEHASDMKRLQKIIDEVYGSDVNKFKGKMFLDIYQGKDVTPEKIRKFYTSLGFNSKQSLLFYYSGHGGTDEKKGHYFAMSGGDILRSEVYNLMLDTGAQGVFLLSDCCSNMNPVTLNKTVATGPKARSQFPTLMDAVFSSGINSPAEIAAKAVSFQPPAGKQANAKLFYDLFYKTEGVVNFTAATRGQLGWGTANGSFMTQALAEYLCASNATIRSDGRDGPVTWADLFARVRSRTEAIFQQIKSTSPDDNEIKRTPAQTPQSFGLGGWPKQYRKQLVVKNNTDKTIKVFLKYYDVNFTNNNWEWYNPTEGGKSYTLKPGAETTLRHNDWTVGAYRARIWATSSDGAKSWNQYRDQDLFVAPKDGYVGQFGKHVFNFNNN